MLRFSVLISIVLSLWSSGSLLAQPTFAYTTPDRTVQYSSSAIVASFDTVASFVVTSGSPGVQGFSFGLAHDPGVLEVQDLDMTPTLATIWSGSEPAFYSAEILIDGLTVGVVIGFFDSGATVDYQTGDQVDLVEVGYQVPPSLIATDVDTVTELTFVDTLGTPPVPSVVVSLGSSYAATHTPALITIQPSPGYRRGDCNDDGTHNIADGVRILDFLFAGAEPLGCFGACDINDDDQHNIADAVYLFEYLLFGGPPPPAPFGSCADDGAECVSYESCP